MEMQAVVLSGLPYQSSQRDPLSVHFQSLMQLNKGLRKGILEERKSKHRELQTCHDMRDAILNERGALQKVECEWSAVPVGQSCSALVAHFTPRSLSNLSKAEFSGGQAVLDWNRQHEMLKRTAWPHQEPKALAELCFVAGRCICQGEGQAIRRLHAAVRKNFRAICPNAQTLRKVWGGELVIRWRALECAGQLARRQAQGQNQESSAGGSDNFSIGTWTFVSLYYTQHPWRPTLVPMTLDVADIERLRAFDEGGGILTESLRLRCQFEDSKPIVCHIWDFLENLDKGQVWRMQVWWASGSDRATAALTVMHVTASIPLIELEAWNPNKRPRLRRRRLPLHMQEDVRRPTVPLQQQQAFSSSAAVGVAAAHGVPEPPQAALQEDGGAVDEYDGDDDNEDGDEEDTTGMQSPQDDSSLDEDRVLERYAAEIEQARSASRTSDNDANSSSSTSSSSSTTNASSAASSHNMNLDAARDPESGHPASEAHDASSAAPADQRPVRLRVHPRASHSWGIFRLVPVRRGGPQIIGWQMTCHHPQHPPTATGALCTRSMNWRDAEEEALALRTLKYWAVQGLGLQTRTEHMNLARRPRNLPEMEVLDADIPEAWPH